MHSISTSIRVSGRVGVCSPTSCAGTVCLCYRLLCVRILCCLSVSRVLQLFRVVAFRCCRVCVPFFMPARLVRCSVTGATCVPYHSLVPAVVGAGFGRVWFSMQLQYNQYI